MYSVVYDFMVALVKGIKTRCVGHEKRPRLEKGRSDGFVLKITFVEIPSNAQPWLNLAAE